MDDIRKKLVDFMTNAGQQFSTNARNDIDLNTNPKRQSERMNKGIDMSSHMATAMMGEPTKLDPTNVLNNIEEWQNTIKQLPNSKEAVEAARRIANAKDWLMVSGLNKYIPK